MDAKCVAATQLIIWGYCFIPKLRGPTARLHGPTIVSRLCRLAAKLRHYAITNRDINALCTDGGANVISNLDADVLCENGGTDIISNLDADVLCENGGADVVSNHDVDVLCENGGVAAKHW